MKVNRIPEQYQKYMYPVEYRLNAIQQNIRSLKRETI